MPDAATPPVTVADEVVVDPLARLARYAKRYPDTLLRYDLGPVGDPNRVTSDDVARTRVINSRIGRIEGERLVVACGRAADLFADLPVTAHLRDADPAEHGGLYDQALTVFNRLLAPGIRFAKLSKVLHLKRPHLFPILDSRILAAYRRTAAEAASRYRTERPGFRLLYWAAVRDDVTSSGNIAALAALRERLRQHPDSRVQRAATLTDVRLLDILSWQPRAPV